MKTLKLIVVTLTKHQAQLIEVVGLSALVAGVALVYLPAGLIVAGVCVVLLAQGFRG